MNFPIKIKRAESADHFILPTMENETRTGSSHDKYSETWKIKTEPTENSDNSEYDPFEVEYLDDDSELEHIHEGHANSNQNATGCKKLRTRSTPAQCEKMLVFMRSYSETLNGIRRDDVSDVWKALTVELNELGPPHRTTAEWRRAWTVFKYNKNQQKRKVPVCVDGTMKRIRFGNSAGKIYHC